MGNQIGVEWHWFGRVAAHWEIFNSSKEAYHEIILWYQWSWADLYIDRSGWPDTKIFQP